MHHFNKYARKVGALVVGIPLFIIGIILLPLPGPGMLIIFLSLVILSMEFTFLKPYRDRMEKEARGLFTKLKSDSSKSGQNGK